VTAAGLQKPGPRAEAPRPRGLLGHPGPRLVRLHLASRRVPGALAALALCALVLRAALIWHWSLGNGNGAQQLPVLLEAGAASIIAVTAQSPFGDPERATGRWLPDLRLGTAAGLCALAVGLLQLGVAGEGLNGGFPVLARNVIGMTGLGLLCTLITGGLLAWTLPLGYMAFCQYALLESWTSPWTWPVRPPGDRGAWICACLSCAIGLALFTMRGPRTQLSDSG
jgi:hypothetical protein